MDISARQQSQGLLTACPNALVIQRSKRHCQLSFELLSCLHARTEEHGPFFRLIPRLASVKLFDTIANSTWQTYCLWYHRIVFILPTQIFVSYTLRERLQTTLLPSHSTGSQDDHRWRRWRRPRVVNARQCPPTHRTGAYSTSTIPSTYGAIKQQWYPTSKSIMHPPPRSSNTIHGVNAEIHQSTEQTQLLNFLKAQVAMWLGACFLASLWGRPFFSTEIPSFRQIQNRRVKTKWLHPWVHNQRRRQNSLNMSPKRSKNGSIVREKPVWIVWL